MLHQVDVNCKTEFTRGESAAYAQLMLRRIHRGGGFFYYSTKADFGGYEQDWRLVSGSWLEPKPAWVDERALYFSVNSHTEIPKVNGSGKRKSPKWVRGTIANISRVNALFCEIDAKDTITQAEWMPQYVLPDLTGIEDEPQKVRGAFQRAQTAAIEATLPLNLVEYKQRAYDRIAASPLAPSALWDSGGGWQAVWFLDESIVLGDDNREFVAYVQKQWVGIVGGDPAASDLNRVLRLPGSTNWKKLYGENGKPVVFRWCDFNRVYRFTDLAALVPPVPEKKKAPVRRVYVPAGFDPKLGEFVPAPELPRHPAIDEYNARVSMRDLLAECEYTDAGGDRMSRPGQPSSGGVQLNEDNTANFFSAADPMYCDHRLTPAHVLCVFRFGGDVVAMLDWLTSGAHSAFLAQLDAVRYWGRTTNFSTVEPTLLSVRADGTTRYPSDSNDTKVMDALCDEWAAAGTFVTKAIGKKRLGVIAGVSANSAQAAVERLARFLVTVEQDPDGYGMRIGLDLCRFKQIDPLFANSIYDTGINLLQPTQENGATVLQLDVDEYAPRKAHDVFQSGVSRYVRTKMRAAVPGDWWHRPANEDRPDPVAEMWDAVDNMAPAEWEAQRDTILENMDAALKRKPKPTREQRAWDRARRGLGEKSLRVLDALVRCGDMTAQETADECAMSLSSARSTLARLYQFMPEYITKAREGSRGKTVYGVSAEAFAEAESRASELKTYKIAACREDKRLQEAQLWAQRNGSAAKSRAEKAQAERRSNKLANKRAVVLADINGLDLAEAHRAARDLPVRQWTQKRAEMARARQEAADREEFRRRIGSIANLMSDDLKGLTRQEAAHHLRIAEYDAADVHLILEHLVERGDVLAGSMSMHREVKVSENTMQDTQLAMVA